MERTNKRRKTFHDQSSDEVMQQSEPEQQKEQQVEQPEPEQQQQQQELDKRSKKEQWDDIQETLETTGLERDYLKREMDEKIEVIEELVEHYIEKYNFMDEETLVDKQQERRDFEKMVNDQILENLDDNDPSTEIKETEKEYDIVRKNASYIDNVTDKLENSNVLSERERGEFNATYQDYRDIFGEYKTATESLLSNIQKKIEIGPLDDSDDNNSDSNNDGNNSSNNPGSGGVGGDNNTGNSGGDNVGDNNTGNSGGDNVGNSRTGNTGNTGTSNASLIDDYADVSLEMPSYMDPED